MNAHEKIRARRADLGLSDVEVASQAKMSIHQYADVEQHAGEFASVLTLLEAKRLCKVLGLNLAELAEIDSVATSFPLHSPTSQHEPRNSLVSKRRVALGISQHQLAEDIGFEDNVIDQIEREPNYLDNWPIELIITLAMRLDLSPQILLGESKYVSDEDSESP